MTPDSPAPRLLDLQKSVDALDDFFCGASWKIAQHWRVLFDAWNRRTIPAEGLTADEAESLRQCERLGAGMCIEDLNPNDVTHVCSVLRRRLAGGRQGRGEREPSAEVERVADGYVIAPHFRGYALLGTEAGAYFLSHSMANAQPELYISVAPPALAEKLTPGDTLEFPDGTDLPVDSIAVRLAFASEVGLATLERQLRLLRETHFAPSPATEAPGDADGLRAVRTGGSTTYERGYDHGFSVAAALRQSPPAGFVMVPETPTQAMLAATMRPGTANESRSLSLRSYEAMLAAAPTKGPHA